MGEIRRTLKWVGCAGILIAWLPLHLGMNAEDWRNSFLLNLGTGFIGGIAVIYFYDWRIRQKEASAKKERQQLTIRSLGFPIRETLSLITLLRETTNYSPKSPLRKVLADLDFYDEVIKIDYTTVFEGFDGIFFKFILDNIFQIHRRIELILAREVTYIPLELVEELDIFQNGMHVRLIQRIQTRFNVNQTVTSEEVENLSTALLLYGQSLLKLIDIYNQHCNTGDSYTKPIEI